MSQAELPHEHQGPRDLAVEPAASTQRWCRISVLDLGAIVLGSALACPFIYPRTSLLDWRRRTTSLGWPVAVIEFIILSSLFCGPLLLFVQWIKGRRVGLSLGERLMFVQPALLILLPITRSFEPFLNLRILFIALECVVAFLSFVCLRAPFEMRQRATCSWTDQLGCLSACLIGFYILLNYR